MAKKKGSEAVNDLEAVDLISLLSMPDNTESYEIELSVPEQDLDLIALGAEQLKEEQLAKSRTTSSVKPIPPQIATITTPTILTTPTTITTTTTPTTPTKTVVKLQQTQTKTVNILTPIQGFENDSFEQIRKDISACQLCGLCKTRKNVVPGVGNEHAKLVLIGEAPGADEDIQGIPFVGKAGKHLDKILAAAGFKKEDLYICNILKCRPPNNRDPNLAEMKVCTPYLQRQLALIKPKLIGCLGNISAHYVISPSIPGITRIRGQWFNSIFGIPTFAMYHPSYLIRSESREKGSPNWQMWQDIRALKAKYDSL